MLNIKPELQQLNPLVMTVKDPRHITDGGVVGFSSAYDHGGILGDLKPKQGASIVELGTKIGALPHSGGPEGINRVDPSSFANVMLSAIDKVSDNSVRADNLMQQAIVDPNSVDIHDITIAQAEASMSLNIARTVLNRVTQGWRDLINAR
jgi:flagellar hook-basal body complex protein FliE